jgi:nucleolar GTP-binding protein
VFEKVPTVLSAQEILDQAFGKANKIEVPDPEKYHRIRKTEEAQMRAIFETAHGTLERLLKSFPTLERMPAYELEVIEILVGLDRLKKALANLQWAHDTLQEVYHDVARSMKEQRTILGLQRQKRRFSGRASSILYDIDKDLTFLNKARDTVRMLPTIHPEYPTVVIAGFPNVGKSSLLAAWTRAHPEIAPYSFTTKQAQVGHFDATVGKKQVTVQVVDTPGLLDRPDEKRNAVERQAVAALRHAADAVLFLLDPTEQSGSTLAEQESLLEQVKREMSGVPMLVAETKADLKKRKSPHLKFSTTTKEGLPELQQAIVALLPADEPELERDPLELWKSKRDPLFG